MNSKNILFIIPSLSYGGAETQTVQQINSLFERGESVFLCVLTNELHIIDNVKIAKDSIIILENKINTLKYRSILEALHSLKKLVAFCKENHITHVVGNLPLG